MRTALLVAALASVPSGVSASAGGAEYLMHGPCRVRTTSGPIVFDRTYDPELRATVSGTDKDLRIDVSGEGLTCTLRGEKKGTVVTLPPGQRCPVRVVRDGVHADLDGVLTSSAATLVGKNLTLITHWDVAGKVKLAFKSVKVKGVVDTNVKGARK